MCGILGSPNITPQVRSMLPFIAMRMEERGTQAWGASNGVEIVKHLGPISVTWGEERERFARWDRGIFHTRLASQGSSSVLANAHPFQATSADGITYTGIHNGCLSNHSELNKTYSRSCNVDSEHLWLHRAGGHSWKDISGYANLAWFEDNPQDEATQPELYLARINSTFLDVVHTEDGGLVFASTKSALMQAAGLCGVKITGSFFIRPETIYHARADGTLWDTEEKAEFAGHYSVSAATAARGGSADSASFTQTRRTNVSGTGGAGSGTSSTTSYAGRCNKCSREKSSSGFLLCDQCFGDIAETYVRLWDKEHKRAVTPLVVLAAEAKQLLLAEKQEPSGGFTEDEMQELEEFAYAHAR